MSSTALAVIQAIAAAFFKELATSIASYFTSQRNDATNQALGRTEAERDAAIAAAVADDAMNGVPLPSSSDLLKRLGDGTG